MDKITVPRFTARQVQEELARRSFFEYCKYVHGGAWTPGKHHRLIAQELQTAIEGGNKRLMIWMPPQHGKSMEVTETFPSYFLGKYPDKHVIEVSYQNDYAEKFGRANREKVRTYGPALFGHGLDASHSSVTNWQIAGRRGGMLSVGVGGGITGEGGDLIIIDDPIKNRQEADSPTYRERIHKEYQSTIYTRRHPDTIIIIVMTRWHEDDICGRLLNPDYGKVDDWKVLSLPAVCESPDDRLGRAIGETLWPEHGYDQRWAAEAKASVGSYSWAGLYQQRPAPLEGGLFKRKWFSFWEALPARFDRIVQSWDCTFKDNDTSDYVAGHVWGRAGGRFYLLDRVHARMGIIDTISAIRTLSAKWPEARAKYIEDKANGSAVIEMLSREIPGIIAVNPQGGKVVRAQAVAPYAEAGNVLLPSPAMSPWVHDMLEELTSFPNAAHDDDVDAMSQALVNIANNGTISMPKAIGTTQESYWRKR